MEAPRSYYSFVAMYAPYTTVINEYCEANFIDICIPYCQDLMNIDNPGSWTDIPLSDFMYQLSEVPTDAIAVRSGHQEEYAKNNLSLPEELFFKARDYFNSKYIIWTFYKIPITIKYYPPWECADNNMGFYPIQMSIPFLYISFIILVFFSFIAFVYYMISLLVKKIIIYSKQ